MREGERRPDDAARRHHDQPPQRVSPGAARLTGLQNAINTQKRMIDGWRSDFSPRELAVILDLVARVVDAEITKNERAQRRWAA